MTVRDFVAFFGSGECWLWHRDTSVGRAGSKLAPTIASIPDRGAALDGDGLAGLVAEGGLGADDEHRAHAAFAFGEVADLRGGGEAVAGADVVEVLDVGAAVEDALVGDVEAEDLGGAHAAGRG